VLSDAVEAAELNELGAMATLISPKLSQNAQFQDKAGACKLIETAVARGDQSMAHRLPERQLTERVPCCPGACAA
jgi:hypothetical protein